MSISAESLYKKYCHLSSCERMQFLNLLRKPLHEGSDIYIFGSNGEPLTQVQYVVAINEAIAAVERGEVFNDEDVMSELETEY